MSLEWDNLRAAHLWALACEDITLAERLVDVTFYYAYGLIVHEHADWLQRTAELGESLGMPSTAMLGLWAGWLNVQGAEAESLRAAERGIEVASSPDDQSTTWCWCNLCGASSLLSGDSSGERNAFEHLQASVVQRG